MGLMPGEPARPGPVETKPAHVPVNLVLFRTEERTAPHQIYDQSIAKLVLPQKLAQLVDHLEFKSLCVDMELRWCNLRHRRWINGDRIAKPWHIKGWTNSRKICLFDAEREVPGPSCCEVFLSTEMAVKRGELVFDVLCLHLV